MRSHITTRIGFGLLTMASLLASVGSTGCTTTQVERFNQINRTEIAGYHLKFNPYHAGVKVKVQPPRERRLPRTIEPLMPPAAPADL